MKRVPKRRRAWGTGRLFKRRGSRFWYLRFYTKEGKRRTVATRTANRALAEQMLRERVKRDAGYPSPCAICGLYTRRLHQDHDHQTGQLRGKLCGPCNCAIGLLRESPRLFTNAVLYLARWATEEDQHPAAARTVEPTKQAVRS